MKLYFILVLCVMFFINTSCVHVDSHPGYEEKNSVQLYVKNFGTTVRTITVDLVSDDIKVVGDAKGATYVIVRAYGSGITDLSLDDLQARVDKYYDVEIHQNGADELYISAKPKLKNITGSEGLAFYFEVHTSISSAANIKNVSGDIKVTQLASVNASIVSGDVDLQNISGSANAYSASGGIAGDNIMSVQNITSVSGDIKMKINSLSEDATVQSTSGDVHLQIPVQVHANINITSVSGDVKINNFSSVNYSAKSDNKAVGTVNNGGKNLLIHSTSGDIIIN